MQGPNRKRRALLGGMLALVCTVAGLAASHLAAPTYATVVAALRARGASVQEDGAGTQPFLGGADHRLTVNGAGVDVFEYRTTLGASYDASRISSDGATITNGFGPIGRITTVDFVAPSHWFHAGRVIVLYVGRESGILALLRGVLGPQFAGQR